MRGVLLIPGGPDSSIKGLQYYTIYVASKMFNIYSQKKIVADRLTAAAATVV